MDRTIEIHKQLDLDIKNKENYIFCLKQSQKIGSLIHTRIKQLGIDHCEICKLCEIDDIEMLEIEAGYLNGISIFDFLRLLEVLGLEISIYEK